jgi:hypothetical protein
MGLLPRPVLVAAAVAGPDLYCGAVGGASAGHIEAEARSRSDDGAVGVEGPLLVGTIVAVPDLHQTGPGCPRLSIGGGMGLPFVVDWVESVQFPSSRFFFLTCR